MKKFSNQEVKREPKSISPKIDKIIDILVKEHINIQYNGDEKDIENNELTIEGIETLKEKFNELINNEIEKSKNQLNESIKYNFGYVDQVVLNDKIKILENTFYEDYVPSPEDIFSPEDYEFENYNVKLTSFNYVPDSYLDFLNINLAYKYFNEGNSVTIRYSDGWQINFEPNNDYGTVIDADKDKYKKFVKENNDFIGDFLSATRNLVGTNNLLINNLLLDSI